MEDPIKQRLEEELEKANERRERMHALLRLSKRLSGTDNVRSIQLNNEAFSLAEELDDNYGQAFAYRNLAEANLYVSCQITGGRSLTHRPADRREPIRRGA